MTEEPEADVVRQRILLSIVLLLAAFFRFVHLGNSPGWDGDEGYNWSIAHNLLNGAVQRFAFKYTFVDHPPLFYLLAALLMKVWTGDLLALRVLSVSAGVLTCLALYALASNLATRRLGLLAAAVYGCWPLVIMQNRWAYTYNLLALLEVVALWYATQGGAEPRRHGNRMGSAALAGLLAGCALATDQEGIAALIAVVVLVFGRSGRGAAALTLLAGLSVPLLYLAWMWALRGDALLFDLQHTAGRLGGSGILSLVLRLLHLWQFDLLTLIGMAGLVLLPAGLPKSALLLQTALLLLLVLKVRDPNPNFRAAIALLPLLALGLAAVIDSIMRLLLGGALKQPGSRPLATGALIALATLFLVQDATQTLGGYTPAIAAALPQSTRDARAMAAWVNAATRPTDYVIAMPQIAWLLHCRTAEILQAVAISGHGTEFYPDGLGPNRFAWDTRLQAARLLIVDHFTLLWIIDHPRERSLVRRAEAHWRVVYRRGEYTIYANPTIARDSTAR